MDLVPLSEILESHQLGFEPSDFGAIEQHSWDAEPEFTASTEPTEPSIKQHAAKPSTDMSEGSQSSQEDSLGTVLPANWGVHILTLLSKSRVSPPQDCSAASANKADNQQATSAQAQSQVTTQDPERASRQREKNKRAQKRHRDKQRVCAGKFSSSLLFNGSYGLH